MTLRVAFIGCVESSSAALESLLEVPPQVARLVGVMTRRSSNFNADFVDVARLVRHADVPVLHAEDVPEDELQAAWLRGINADVVLCVGWSRLLGPQVLAAAPLGVIGFHPAALPANRGRHPLVWALALGLEETASSFFFMRPEADSGPLLSQVPIRIDPEDDARRLYDKVLSAIRTQVSEVVLGLANGTLEAREQDHRLANEWRRRGADDGRIDWRMAAESVHNLVRALARPYPGAHFVQGEQDVKVWRTAFVACEARNFEPGKVLAVEGQTVLIKCGSDAIRLIEHEMQTLPRAGDYL